MPIDTRRKLITKGEIDVKDLVPNPILIQNNNDTIVIIICKKENKFVIEYCSNDRIVVREYELVWYSYYEILA